MLFALCVTGAAFASLLPPAIAQSNATTGSIAGTVVLSRSLSSRKPHIRMYGEYGPGSLPVITPPPVNELGNVVLYLDSVPPLVALPLSPDRAPAIVQRHETFVPHVLAVVRGTRVEFPNQDPLFHNVFSLSSARTFDLGRYPEGTSKSVVFDRAGVVQVFCHIHSDMSAIVLVLENPFFAVPDSGRYVIAGVPPGDYRLTAWHERVRPIVLPVHVVAGETTRRDLNIPIPVDSSGR